MLSCSGLCFAKNMIENEKNNLIGESNTYKMMSLLLRLGYTGTEAAEITGMSEKDLQEAEHIIGEAIGNKAISDISE